MKWYYEKNNPTSQKNNATGSSGDQDKQDRPMDNNDDKDDNSTGDSQGIEKIKMKHQGLNLIKMKTTKKTPRKR